MSDAVGKTGRFRYLRSKSSGFYNGLMERATSSILLQGRSAGGLTMGAVLNLVSHLIPSAE